MVIQKNSPTNNKLQESKSKTQKNMKPHKIYKWKTMKTQKKLLSKITQYFKISNHTTKDYIPNTQKIEHVHIGIGS